MLRSPEFQNYLSSLAECTYSIEQMLNRSVQLESQLFSYTSRPESYFQAVCGWQEKRHDWKPSPKQRVFSLGVMVPAPAVMESSMDVLKKWSRKRTWPTKSWGWSWTI